MTVQFSIIFKCLDWSLYELYDSTYFKSHDFDCFLVIDLCRLYALKKWFLRILSQIYHISIVQNTKNIACNGDNISKEHSQKPLTLAREVYLTKIYYVIRTWEQNTFWSINFSFNTWSTQSSRCIVFWQSIAHLCVVYTTVSFRQ